MLNYATIGREFAKTAELAAPLNTDDLRRETNDMIDAMQTLIADCTDADVVFVPRDAQATPEQPQDGWTIAHIIVHATASAEEAAFTAAELARGVPNHGRSRYETAWESVTSIAHCRARLEESRRMRLALLDVFPDQPDYALSYELFPGSSHMNAKTRFVFGLYHDFGHVAQLQEAVQQAKAAR